MSLVGSYTQDRLIKREEWMDRGSIGMIGEKSRLVSSSVATGQMVNAMNCKITAHTVYKSKQMAKEEM
jgi:hypothetical protein